MSTTEVAKKFTDALKAQTFADAEALWSDDVVSIENMDGPMARLEGKAAVHGKGEWWFGAHEIHSYSAEGPFVNGDRFAVFFRIDVTNKESGQRTQMDEVGLYKVANGKVIEERFFY
jgi:ketosteroid isomerase-like protein